MGAVVIFAFILFVMGGATAYMGDRLGSYIGKKRHSTFGLRPRHTAMLWTVVSGGVIAVGTLLLFVALNNTFNTALIRGPQLLEANRLLEKQNSKLTVHNLVTEQQAQADNLRAGQAQQKAGQAQQKAENAQVQASQAQQTLLLVRLELGRAKSTLTKSQQNLELRQRDLAQAKQNLMATRQDLGRTHRDLIAAKDRVQIARRGVNLAQRQYRVASNQVVRANQSVLELVKNQDRLHAENAQLARQNHTQQDLLTASQGHTVIFRREEELGRTVISAHQSLDSLRRELAVFLDQVELTARQHGAGGQDNSPAIVIPAPGESASRSTEARESALDALSQNIADQGGFMPSIVVVADARYNTFKGEPVHLDLRPYANVMVFPKGTVIASSALDGDQPEDVILKRLQAFLTEQVRTAALQRGIIPLHDPQSGEPLVGQPIDTPSALALVKQVQQAGSGARITAAAAEDTFSGDLVHLDLHVTPAPSVAATSAAVRE